MFAHRALFVIMLCVASLSCGRADHTITSGREGANDLRRALLQATPPGTPIDSVRAVMQRNAFTCTLRPHSLFAGMPDSADFLYCDKTVRKSFWISARWQTADVYNGGLLSTVYVTRGLIGP
jgi:hypothetical protein